MKTLKFNKSEIFKAAWSLIHKGYATCLSDALCSAWCDAKNAIKK